MHGTKTRKALLATAVVAAAVGTATLANYPGHAADAGLSPPAEAAVPVGVAVMKERPVRLWSSFSGRLRAVDYAEVRPEVGGRIVEVRFEDGQLVKAGDGLFVIDPATYQAAVAKAEANLASATTNAVYAKAELERAAGLIKTGFTTKSAYDARVNGDRMARAAVEAATADLRQARIDLDHATVRAPISGRVSRAEITVGNLVQTGPGAPVLTSIASTQGIYADFEIDEQTYLRDVRGQGPVRQIPVELTVRGDDGRIHPGHVHSFDNRIDTASGTIRTRALFANDDGSLVPGMTVTVRIANGGERPMLLVPQGAVGADQSRKFVFVVGADSRVSYRAVELGRQVGDTRVVVSGLAPGERVVVDGLQHIRPSSLVQARETSETAAVPASRL